jgi:hypothetical protein
VAARGASAAAGDAVSQFWMLKPRSITAPQRMSTLIPECCRWVAAFTVISDRLLEPCRRQTT